jgi:hypothetical protein
VGTHHHNTAHEIRLSKDFLKNCLCVEWAGVAADRIIPFPAVLKTPVEFGDAAAMNLRQELSRFED